MRPIVLTLCLAAAACTAAPSSTSAPGTQPIEVDGAVQYLQLEGGFWALRGDDGVIYEPRALPPDDRKDGLRVRAVLTLRDDLGGFHAVGPVVDVVSLALLPCGPVPCPLPAPLVTVAVVDPGAAAPGDAAWANVTAPPGVVVQASCEGGSAGERRCTLFGEAPGHYEADLGAAGHEPVHLAFDVPARTPLDGECCPVGYVPLWLTVSLVRTP